MTGSTRVAAVSVLGVASALLAGCPSGYRFVRISGEPTLVTPNLIDGINDLAKDAQARCPAGLAPLVHCDHEPALCTRDLLDHTIRDCAALRPLLTFVHLSDAQLKEQQIALDGPLSVASYDAINGGATRNPDLERNDFAVLLATVLGINQLAASSDAQLAPKPGCARPLPPRFVLHTGDSVDAGFFSELFELLGVTSKLEIPFYNVVGNHDNLFFGTFPKARMQGLDVTLPFVPIGSTARFIAAHHPAGYRWDISIPFVPALGHIPTERGEPPKGLPGASPLKSSFYRGFDLVCGTRSASDRICPEARGYYGLDVPLDLPPGGKARALRILALNTAEIGPEEVVEGIARRAGGQMREDQYLWLEQELATKRDLPTYYLVAGHHDLGAFVASQKTWLKDILTNASHVLAYIDGHTHVSRIEAHPRPGRAPLWEITSGSTLVYPQLGQLIELLEDSADPPQMFLRVRSFRQRLSDSGCAAGKACVELAARAENARAGAFADRGADDDWRDERDGVENSNGLLAAGAGFSRKE